MKIFKWLGILLAVVMAFGAYGVYRDIHDNSVELAFDFEPGQTFTLRKESRQFSEIVEGEAAGWAELTHSDYVVDFTVADVDADGTAMLEAAIQSYHIETQDRAGGKTVVGSDQADVFSTMINAAMLHPFKLRVTSRGEMLSVENFDEIEEAFYLGIDEDMLTSPEQAAALTNVFNTSIGTRESVLGTIFSDFFPVWPQESLWPYNDWTVTRKLVMPGYEQDVSRNYVYDQPGSEGFVGFSFTEKILNSTSHDRTSDVEFTDQESGGYIDYKKGGFFPAMQFHRNDYSMSVFIVSDDNRQLVSKADIKTQTRVLYGDEQVVVEAEEGEEGPLARQMKGLQQALDAQAVVDAASESARQSMETLPDYEDAIQSTDRIMRNIEVMEEGFRQERQYQDFIRNMQQPDAAEQDAQ